MQNGAKNRCFRLVPGRADGPRLSPGRRVAMALQIPWGRSSAPSARNRKTTGRNAPLPAGSFATTAELDCQPGRGGDGRRVLHSNSMEKYGAVGMHGQGKQSRKPRIEWPSGGVRCRMHVAPGGEGKAEPGENADAGTVWIGDHRRVPELQDAQRQALLRFARPGPAGL